MKTDRELLELAAKAAGMGYEPFSPKNGYDWNPLNDDGDALRLAVKLRLLVDIGSAHTTINWFDLEKSETHSIEQWDNGMTPEEWTRRAIVRAAAAIGETK